MKNRTPIKLLTESEYKALDNDDHELTKKEWIEIWYYYLFQYRNKATLYRIAKYFCEDREKELTFDQAVERLTFLYNDKISEGYLKDGWK
ncbi:hypothetical protein FW755_12370 [Lonepinella koalarum]|uniref:hypothetical protein n=1 Tax=Lonepinella koalarum TaxID=53417 RepID=UPI0011E448F0|nr:hypothetical protein [Lonepinella koalarum]TYG33352.1 hypothetical protein FW755_12370 [Lonepinella koalarum]